jgi:two-component system CheB/CheR fusion protein
MPKNSSASRGEARARFPVVGIGASAGGLEALRQLFLAAPPDSGAGYIVVQHLDPTHDSLMAELLTKYTDMRVVQAQDNMPVAPDVIHIIPPDRSLTISKGLLKLDRPVERRGMRMPIDLFLTSLAEDQQEAAVGLIMSGTGSDGTYGIRAIKAHGGLVLVQDPASAQYDGMPRSAIATGDADYVLGPGDMPRVIAQYAEVLFKPQIRASLEKSDKDHLTSITALLLARQGYDFGCYKRGTLERRILRRMRLKHIERLPDYHELLRHDTDEAKALINDLLIGVTSFFRDPEAWEFLGREILPELLKRHQTGDRLRVWVPGCATGEEAYSLAMLLVEAVEELDLQVLPVVFATDISSEALETARTGRYPPSIAMNVSASRLQRFFDAADDAWVAKPELREMLVFAPQDLVSDPPFSNVDLISCRNLLIYLKAAYQTRILSWFHFALAEGGFLMLGGSETIGNSETLFRPLSKRWHIYRRIDGVRPRNPNMLFGARAKGQRWLAPPVPRKQHHKFGQLTRKLLLTHFAPAAVLVDQEQRVLYFHGPVSDYLGPTTGEPTTQLPSLADEPLRLKLRSALQQADRHRRRVQVSGARVRRGEEWQPVEVTVHPVQRSGVPEGIALITFKDAPPRPGRKEPAQVSDQDQELVGQLEEELAATRQELRDTIEEMETSSEELKASNEEILSMNEELQSSNEELETSKEELQSLNEELITVNSQLEEKVLELERTTNDLQNLLASTNIATIFIDRAFHIQRYTPAATALLYLISGDVGRRLTDIAWRFSDDHLLDEAGKVLQGEGPFEAEIHADNDRWYLRSLTPYRTGAGVVDGVVITFVDVTERREAALRLRESEQHLKRITDAMPGMISYVDASRRYRFNNAAYESWFGRDPSELPGTPVRDVLGPALYTRTAPYIDAALRGESVSFELVLDDTPLGQRTVHADYIPDVDEDSGEVKGYFAMITDVTERREQQSRIQSLNAHLRQRIEEQEALFEAAPVGLFVARDPQCGDMTMNPAGAKLLRIDPSVNPSLTGPGAGALPFRVYHEGRELKGPQLPIQRAAREGRIVNNEEIEVRFDDGETRLLSVHAAPLYEEDKVRGCIGVLVDSTEYRRAITALAEADRRKDQFLAQLAHELRNPLTPLVAAADLIERHGATGEVIERVRDALVNQTRHLWRLVDDLLDAARVVHDRLELRHETLDLRSAIRDAVATAEAEARARGHQLHLELPDEALSVSGDSTRLTQVFSNLLKNAVNYTPAPGHISVSARREGGRLVALVEDTGSGLSTEDLERIFEPMAGTRNSSHSSGGLGLGLPLAKRIVELHGGSIQAFSEGLDRGSRFTISLPAAEGARTTPSSEGRLPSEEAVPDKLRILIVDDQKDVADAVALLLQMQGYSTDSVAHPDEVVPAIRRFKPQIVLLDIGLPERSGIEVASELAGLDERAAIRVVALSGYAEDAAAPGVNELFDGRLLKPVTAEQLTSLMNDLQSAAG